MRELTDIYKWFEDRDILLFDRQLPFSNAQSKAVTIRLLSNGVTGVFLDRGHIETAAEEAVTLLHEADIVQLEPHTPSPAPST